MIGLVGDDEDAGRRCATQLARSASTPPGIVADPSRCTTRKLRVVTTRNQQVARIDYEDDREVARRVEAAVVARIEQLSPSADAILVSDYLKGVVSRGVAAAAIAAATAPRHPGARRSEGSAHRLLRGRDAHHAESPRGRGGHAHADPHRATKRVAAARRFRERARLRERAHHARRTRDDAARRRRRSRARRPKRAKWRTSPAPATPSSRR